jgi:hypothetical protein
MMTLSNTISGDGYWLTLSSSTDKLYFAASNNGSASANLETTTTMSTGNWYHCCGVSAATNDRRVYLNGGGKNTTTNDVSGVDILDQIHLGYYLGNSWDGPLMEFGVWNTALTDAEVLMLSKGFRPTMVRPQNLVLYFPLVRTPDKCIISGAEMTLQNGTVIVDAHGRMFY